MRNWFRRGRCSGIVRHWCRSRSWSWSWRSCWRSGERLRERACRYCALRSWWEVCANSRLLELLHHRAHGIAVFGWRC